MYAEFKRPYITLAVGDFFLQSDIEINQVTFLITHNFTSSQTILILVVVWRRKELLSEGEKKVRWSLGQ